MRFFLRIPRSGGPVRVVAYPNVDSVVWTSSAASPAPGRVLGFDDDAGLLAMVDSRGRPVRVDFRRDSIELPLREALTAAAALDASSIYGITAKGAVVRTVTTASSSVEWRYFRTAAGARRPAASRRDGPRLERSRVIRDGFDAFGPPDTTADRQSRHPCGRPSPPAAASAIDCTSSKTTSFTPSRPARFRSARPLDAGGAITGLAVSPSGDRVYALATIGGKSVVVAIDRYRWKITSKLALDGYGSRDSRRSHWALRPRPAAC